jgi:hypothetical protein
MKEIAHSVCMNFPVLTVAMETLNIKYGVAGRQTFSNVDCPCSWDKFPSFYSQNLALRRVRQQYVCT